MSYLKSKFGSGASGGSSTPGSVSSSSNPLLNPGDYTVAGSAYPTGQGPRLVYQNGGQSGFATSKPIDISKGATFEWTTLKPQGQTYNGNAVADGYEMTLVDAADSTVPTSTGSNFANQLAVLFVTYNTQAASASNNVAAATTNLASSIPASTIFAGRNDTGLTNTHRWKVQLTPTATAHNYLCTITADSGYKLVDAATVVLPDSVYLRFRAFTGGVSDDILITDVAAVLPLAVSGGADTTAQHYKGAWDNSKAYAANDVVTHAYGLWVALVAAASGVSAPSTNPTYPIANSTVGGSYATTLASAGGGNGNNDVAWPFTTTAAGGVVDTVILGTAQFNANAATVRVGIATAIGSSATTDVVWLGATPSAVSLQASVGQQIFALPAAVTLAGSTTYFLVVQGVSGATPAANTRGVSGGSSPSGIVATANQMYGNSGASRAWGSPFAYAGVWSLVNGSLPYWQKIANTREAVVVAKTAAYTMVDPDTVVLANGTFTVTLPAPSSSNMGKRYTVKNTGTGTVTIASPGAATIDGAANISMTVQYSSLDFANDGTNYYTV